jgi:hypothetical protein
MSNSNNGGSFTVPLTSSLSSSYANPTELPTVLITAPGYEAKEIIPYKGDGTVKEDLGIIQLTPLKISTELEQLKSSQLTPRQIENISKDKKDISFFAQEKLTNVTSQLKVVLIPTVLGMISQFGITKATELIGKSPEEILQKINDISFCPVLDKLKPLIERKNKLVKQINSTYSTINFTTNTIQVNDAILSASQIALQAQLINPIPLPANILEIIDRLKKVISKISSTNNGLLGSLSLLTDVLFQILQLLGLLDKLIEKCYPNTNQEQISAELTALTQQQSNQQSPVVLDVNGFEMGVETENTTNNLKRRRAIARNQQGVVMLKGEWSFSSIDQILIDELVFYIQQNDLKAN